MSCKQSELWMMDALDNLLGDQDHEQLMAHLGTCALCRTEWEALNALEGMLVSPQMLAPAPGFSDRVEARIARFEAQRRTLIGGLILLGAAAALCLLAVPSLLNGRDPIDAYANFLRNTFDLLSYGLVLGTKLLSALWLTLDAIAGSVDIPVVSLLTYAVGTVLAVMAWRRSRVSQRAAAQTRHNGG